VIPADSETKPGSGGNQAKVRNVLVFTSALLLFTLGAAATYITTARLIRAQKWVAHTREVQAALSNVGTLAGRAGRIRAQYVQAGDPAQLAEFEAAVADSEQAIVSVQQLTQDNPQQQAACVHLKDLLDRRIAILRQSIASRRQGVTELQKQNEFTLSNLRVVADMDALIQQMQASEDRLLADRQVRTQRLAEQAVVLFCAAFFFSILLLGLHYFLLNRELTARQHAEMALRSLSARLLEMQDAERRRIARDLHDSLGQYLAGAKMTLEVVARSIPPNALLADSIDILDKAIIETRTISHLLHPPLLDEVGFASAAKWYVQGFSERSGISVALNLPDHLGRLPAIVELTLFRVLQESLTNIHRHSRSPEAQITVSWLPGGIEIEVRDRGKGMSPDVLEKFLANDGSVGIGLAGMRERVRDLGGRIEVRSDESGTLIIATLPVARSVSEDKISVAK
jgi:signal transduction histidine kinase